MKQYIQATRLDDENKYEKCGNELREIWLREAANANSPEREINEFLEDKIVSLRKCKHYL